MHIFTEKWYDFDGETTNLLKYAVFEINDLRCEGGIFRRNWVRCVPQRNGVPVETRFIASP